MAAAPVRTPQAAVQQVLALPELPAEEMLELRHRQGRGLALTERQQRWHDEYHQAIKHNRALGSSSYWAGDYATAIAAYRTLADKDDCVWELAESYMGAGKPVEALAWYRKVMYRKVRLLFTGTLDLSPRAVLPGESVSLEDARKRFPQEEVEVWSDKLPVRLTRFALLLARDGKYAEAIAAYEQALMLQPPTGTTRSEWAGAMGLGNLTPANFDRHRFEAAAYAMMAAHGPDPFWQQLRYEKATYADLERERHLWLDEALRIKCDSAPALYLKAYLILTTWDKRTKEDYHSAKLLLDRAQRHARSKELRALIQQLRKDYTGKLP